MDACRNELKAQVATRSLDARNATIPAGVGALFSCSSGQRTFETSKLGKGHGVFFYRVIEGLGGEATNRKGEVTWDSLTAYVKEKVAEDVPTLIGGGARQTPHQISNLQGSPILRAALNGD
jgi:uncharacterized caspase-like protein